jgi:hypothetical protein
MAEKEQDEKAMASAKKKTTELKVQLNLTVDQQKSVLDILYVSFRDLKQVKAQEDLSMEQKITRYDQINKTARTDLQKVLTSSQYQKFLSPERGR